MAELLVHARETPDENGSIVRVTPESAGWEYVGFEVFRLRAGQVLEQGTEDQEVCVVFLAGRGHVSAGDNTWEDVGGRTTVFDGPPHAIHLPPNTPYRVEAATDELEIAIAFAPAEEGVEPALIRPEDIAVTTRGSGSTERELRPVLFEDRPAERLLIMEVVTPEGHWSSFPPHKHDQDDRPNETFLEETYYHRIKPEQGFGFQRVYTEDGSLDETVSFGDRDTVLVPKGHHVVSAMPGYDLYYLNVMAGPVREWKVKWDPVYEWLRG